MKAEFARELCCPAPECKGAELVLDAHQIDIIRYKVGPVEEVRTGTLTCCVCGRAYPIEEYVPSFEQLFPPDLREEAEYWSKWYGFMWDRGHFGYFDLRLPRAPLIAEGIEVLDPSSLDQKDPDGSHSVLADHPLVRDAERILDVGCGTGWSSLYLARLGHKVVGFDPSTSNMRRAKRYAIVKGEYIEYLGAALGYLAFRPGRFDAIFALHSIHHVPRLREEMVVVRSWLRDGGAIAIDEHIHNDEVLGAIAGEMHAWARAEVYPKVRTLPSEELQKLPVAPHSSLEGAGSSEVISALIENFTLESFYGRYVSLDFFSFIYYISRNLDELLFHKQSAGASGHLVQGGHTLLNLDVRAYGYGADVLGRFYDLFSKAFPMGAEYVTLVGRKDDQQAAYPNALPQLATQLMRVDEQALRLPHREPSEIIADDEKVEENRRILDTAVASLWGDVEMLNNVVATKNTYIGKLERTVEVKNEHIRKLEHTVREQRKVLSASGRVLHLLNTVATLIKKRR